MRTIIMKLNYRFRRYPTKEQELVLEQTLDDCRWVYNYFLGKSDNNNMSKEDMQFALTELKEQHPWLRNYYHSKMLQMVVHKIGKLHYMSHEDYNSFTYNQSGFKLDNSVLVLSKIGNSIRIVLHRKLLPVNVKQVTVCRKNSKWYAVVACELLRKPFSSIIRYSKPIGIDDVGITKFCHDSDDHSEDNLQFLTRMLNPLRRAHRRVSSRRQIGSSNREKAKHMLARLYERIHNRRRDFLHKTSAYYASRYDLIFLERLRVANLTRNHRLASRKILDASWSTTFKHMLQYKANRVVEVEPAYTSIDCSRCGHPVPKSLAVRTHACPKCNAVMDRDYNASLNILHRGLESLMMMLLLLLQELREVAPVEIVQQQRSRRQEEEEAIGLVL